MRCLRFYLLCAQAIAMSLPNIAFSQGKGADNFPLKPVSVIVPFAPGGSAEREARLYVTKMSALMGQPFVLDFKPGNGSIVGTAYVAKSAPDGHTLLVVTSSFTIFPALFRDLPFDAVRDFAPVSLVSRRATVLLQSPSFPPRSFADYIAYAKANPGKINYATAGSGGGVHLAGAWMHSATNTVVTFVPYKGTGPILADLVSGRVDVTAAYFSPAVTPMIKAGKIRVLAITSLERSSLLPGVQTVAEQGIPGFNYSAWNGIAAPAATPTLVVSKISASFANAVKSPDVASVLAASGAEAVGSTPLQFKLLIAAEAERWKKVIQNAGIKLEQ